MKKNRKKAMFTTGAIALGCLCCFNYKTPRLNTNNLIDNVVGVYLQNEDGTYIKSDTIPQSGYKLNSSKSTCNNNVTPSWSSKGLKLSNLKKGTSCYLYFDELEGFTISDVIAKKTIGSRGDSITGIFTEDTTGTVFTAEDDDGTSYYYAGAPTDNYVKFAGKYWRIIRVNGDGSIRMIYAGDVATIDALDNKLEVLTNGYDDSTTQYTQIGTSAFNSLNNNNMYVGFMYTSNQVHGFETTSTIKGELDKWYSANLKLFANYMDTDAGFCGDREPSTSNVSSDGLGGIGTTQTYYGYLKFLSNNSWLTPQNVTYKCKNSSDLYTVGISNKGNKALTNPIGLITADEVVYGGGYGSSANGFYYLSTGNFYWTLSPYYFAGSKAYVFCTFSTGNLSYYNVDYAHGIRPVINLRADTIFKEGTTGTADNPYVVI